MNIGNTFGYYNYVEIFKKNKITKYVLLQKIIGHDKYYIVSNTCSIDDPDCIFFILNDDLSIHEKKISLDKIKNIQPNKKIYFYDTHNYNLARGKMYKNNLIN